MICRDIVDALRNMFGGSHKVLGRVIVALVFPIFVFLVALDLLLAKLCGFSKPLRVYILSRVLRPCVDRSPNKEQSFASIHCFSEII